MKALRKSQSRSNLTPKEVHTHPMDRFVQGNGRTSPEQVREEVIRSHFGSRIVHSRVTICTSMLGREQMTIAMVLAECRRSHGSIARSVEALSSMKGDERKRAASSHNTSTGVGPNGLHSKVPWELRKETCEHIVGFLTKVEQCGC